MRSITGVGGPLIQYGLWSFMQDGRSHPHAGGKAVPKAGGGHEENPRRGGCAGARA